MLKYKINRQVGSDIFKGLNKRKYAKLFVKRVMKRKTKSSFFHKIIRQRKILKIFYNLSEKQYKNIFKTSFKNAYYKQNPLILLETRLDIFLMRVRWAHTMLEAKQLILHGRVLVNGCIMTYASFILTPGDIVQIVQEHCGSVQASLKQFLSTLKKKKRVIRKKFKKQIKYSTDKLFADLRDEEQFEKTKQFQLNKFPLNKFQLNKFQFRYKFLSNNRYKRYNKYKHKRFKLKQNALKKIGLPNYIHVNYNILSAILLNIPSTRHIPHLVNINPPKVKKFYISLI